MTAVADDSFSGATILATPPPSPSQNGVDTLGPLPVIRARTRERLSSRSAIYVTRRIPQLGVEILLRTCDVRQWDSELAVPPGELRVSVRGVHAILCLPSDHIDKDVLDAAGPQLRVVATMSSDSQHIDVAECYRRRIKVITCPDQPADTKAQLTIALVLLTLEASLTDEEKKITIDLRSAGDPTAGTVKEEPNSRRPLLRRRQSEELLAFQWTNGKPGNTNCLMWRNIVQKTFGIYGLSTTGTSLARLLKTLGVARVIAADLEITQSTQDDAADAGYDIVEVDQLLARSDIVCVCGSSEEKTEKLFCRPSFEKMKREAVLVTTQSEEPDVDYVDLYDALRVGHIKAAGLNDCNQVPVPFKTPLQGLKNCVFLPQSQESVYDMRHQVSVLVAKKLVCALESAI